MERAKPPPFDSINAGYQAEFKPGRGGYRPGSGRKPGPAKKLEATPTTDQAEAERRESLAYAYRLLVHTMRNHNAPLILRLVAALKITAGPGEKPPEAAELTSLIETHETGENCVR